MNRKYETIFILQPDLADEETKAVTDKVHDVAAAFKAELKKLEDWGPRKLAYPLRKFNRGRYYYARFDASAEMIAELERRLRLDDKVLRYQSVKLEKEPAPPAEKTEAKPVSEAVESE